MREFDLGEFNEGDYIGAIEARARSENICRVLYPSDNVALGRTLRLAQEYFFVSATLQDIIRRYRKRYEMFDAPRGLRTFDRFADKVAIQLNDTHPALAIPELMRILVDAEELGWDEAWDITTRTFGYTNHTVMPEALERWTVALLGQLLPRHLQIIYEINARFLGTVRARFGPDDARCRRMSLIDEDGERRVRMAALAIVGSHGVNGVAALHTEILRTRVFRDFDELWPEQVQQQDQRHHPAALAAQVQPRAGAARHRRDRERVDDRPRSARAAGPARRRRRPRPRVAGDQAPEQGAAGRDHPAPVRAAGDAGADRSGLALRRAGEADPRVQAPAPESLARRDTLQPDRGRPGGPHLPRTVIFGGKAAPGYTMAKLIIRLINDVAEVVNADPGVRDLLKVVFLADYRVSLAEEIIPAAELSEQISTAGTEASGTGNMKFALNGALTIGTMDGANIEICQEVGDGQHVHLRPHRR